MRLQTVLLILSLGGWLPFSLPAAASVPLRPCPGIAPTDIDFTDCKMPDFAPPPNPDVYLVSMARQLPVAVAQQRQAVAIAYAPPHINGLIALQSTPSPLLAQACAAPGLSVGCPAPELLAEAGR